MKVVIVRREPEAAISMDVYADGLVAGLKTVRPEWKIIEIVPQFVAQLKSPDSRMKSLLKYYGRFWQHPHEVVQQSADIVHIIDHTSGHLARWLTKANRSVVVTCHDLVQLIHPENTGQTFFPQLSLAAWRYSVKGMRQADHIIAVSTNTKRDITAQLHIAADQITVIPNAVEAQFTVLPPEQAQAFRQQQGIAPNTICLLNVGSGHPRKNLYTVLKVLHHLKLQGVSVHLWKVGTDFSQEQKQWIQAYGLKKNVTHLGKSDKHSLVQIYNAADVLLAPSLYEGFGFTILEAMACGTPVITSNTSSLPEVANDAAILLNPLDVQAMVDTIYQLQNPSHRQILIDRGIMRARKFTWENTAEQTAKLYERLVLCQKYAV